MTKFIYTLYLLLAALVHHGHDSHQTTRSEHRIPWAESYKAVRVANCESGGGPNDASRTYDGNAHLRDPNGHYGKWQFDLDTWYSVGGTGNPADFSENVQDKFAYKLFLQRGWQPWECAGMI